MSSGTKKDLVASINGRLHNRAKEMRKPFGEDLQYYGIERFLYRLSKTDYGTKFVLKGGLVFYAWELHLRRPTRDIDLRGYTGNSKQNILAIMKEICLYHAPEDCLVYHPESIQVTEIIPYAEYQGLRVNLLATLSQSEIPIQIDIGFMDEVTPGTQEILYPILLHGMEAPQLRGYSRESIISEKLHAMVRLDEINSRLKDFYDVWLLSEQFDFDGVILKQAIQATFRRRDTEIPTELPTAFSDDFAKSQQIRWQSFLRKHNLALTEIEVFASITARLRVFLLPPLLALVADQPFLLCWKAGRGWE